MAVFHEEPREIMALLDGKSQVPEQEPAAFGYVRSYNRGSGIGSNVSRPVESKGLTTIKAVPSNRGCLNC
jgi:hypothetical protein